MDPSTISFRELWLANSLASSDIYISSEPVTEIKSPMFPFSKIIPQFKYSTAAHLVIVQGPQCWWGTFFKVSAGYLPSYIPVQSIPWEVAYFSSFRLKNIPTPMLILYLFSSNLDSLVLFHSYISCSIVDLSFYLFWSFWCKTNRNTTF